MFRYSFLIILFHSFKRNYFLTPYFLLDSFILILFVIVVVVVVLFVFHSRKRITTSQQQYSIYARVHVDLHLIPLTINNFNLERRSQTSEQIKESKQKKQQHIKVVYSFSNNKYKKINKNNQINK